MVFAKEVENLINTNKLKGKIVENGLNVEALAHQMELDITTVYRKIRGESDFTVREVSEIASILKLSEDDLTAIFFAN